MTAKSTLVEALEKIVHALPHETTHADLLEMQDKARAALAQFERAEVRYGIFDSRCQRLTHWVDASEYTAEKRARHWNGDVADHRNYEDKEPYSAPPYVVRLVTVIPEPGK